MANKVFVSGCFDLLHSGHVEFFRQAAEYGDLYVALGSDKTIFDLKGRSPINSEEERRFMVEAVSFVHQALISRGSGYLDFADELKETLPDVFVVNEDGNTLDKRKLCASLGIEYKVLRRQPQKGFEARSTTALRDLQRMPYRIDLAGGWLDQPFVSKHHPGSVITLSIEPTFNFNERSGMATSTRHTAIEIWGSQLPSDRLEKTARIFFVAIIRRVASISPALRIPSVLSIPVLPRLTTMMTIGRNGLSTFSRKRCCDLSKTCSI